MFHQHRNVASSVHGHATSLHAGPIRASHVSGDAPVPAVAPLPTPPTAKQTAAQPAAVQPGSAIALATCPICERQMDPKAADRHVDSCMRKHEAAEASASRKRSAPRQGANVTFSVFMESKLDLTSFTADKGWGLTRPLDIPLQSVAICLRATIAHKFSWPRMLRTEVMASANKKQKKLPAEASAGQQVAAPPAADGIGAATEPLGLKGRFPNNVKAAILASVPAAEAPEGDVPQPEPAAAVVTVHAALVTSPAPAGKEASPKAAPSKKAKVAPRNDRPKPAPPAASALRGVYLVPQRSAARAADARLKSAVEHRADDPDASVRERNAHAPRSGMHSGGKPKSKLPKSRLSTGAAGAGGAVPGLAGGAAAQRGVMKPPRQPAASKTKSVPKAKVSISQKPPQEDVPTCSRSRPLGNVRSEQKAR